MNIFPVRNSYYTPKEIYFLSQHMHKKKNLCSSIEKHRLFMFVSQKN
ncbi:hypothetical protein HMPREF0373_03228 [Eubacterium ramulus ATCC 29099]|uniref:Uncharacterized protein n=1 Tax=Eubacterium ramulus ATCC 29099 TaxID=1256908 RepID=U2QJM2_EUBRA|nr:hypothetical protein HMPREF0373_03228 [Eubacterium ramulus ATCC 29099]